MAAKKPVGSATRGTTNPNRLRRIDRYLTSLPVLRQTEAPIVVDLGYGASPITAVELLERCQAVNPQTRVLGIEIDRERVERGRAIAHAQLQFALGGFETPMPASFGADSRASVIRALNVLRQYDESEVAAAWDLMCSRLTPDGVLIEGTCDEIGRLASWVTLSSSGPRWFTISLRLAGLELPSKVAERLPKALIHHNVAGEPIHEFLQALDLAWLTQAGLGTFSPQQRWVATCQQIYDAGWPALTDKRRWKLGELTLPWAAVAPTAAAIAK